MASSARSSSRRARHRRTRGVGSTERTWRAQAELGHRLCCCTSCVTTSITRVSLPPMRTACGPPSPNCPRTSRSRPPRVTAHSIPVAMNASSGPSGGLYLDEHRETARLVAEAVRAHAPSSIWSGNPAPAVPCAMAATRYQRSPANAGRAGNCGGRRQPDGLRVGPSRGAMGPRHRSTRDRCGAGTALRASGDRRH